MYRLFKQPRKPYFVDNSIIRYFFHVSVYGAALEQHFFRKHFYYITSESAKYLYLSTFSRSSTIPDIYEGFTVRVYRGKCWRLFVVRDWCVGFKFGEFARTRIRALFKAKSVIKKKKAKQTKTPTEAFLQELTINKMKLLKAGKIRKQHVLLSDNQTKYTTIVF